MESIKFNVKNFDLKVTIKKKDKDRNCIVIK